MISQISTFIFRPKVLALIIILITIPALFINLGLVPLIDDEGIRALVSYEMKLRHNLIVPTLGGEFYFNKPPVYNWILLGFFELTKNLSYFVIRIPTVIFVYIYSFTIFLISSKIFGKRAAFIHALAFLTCGRILFYDSFRGLIDTSFSWIVYLSFMSVYFYCEKEKYLKAFAFAYILTAIAFLMKGLPAIVFLGITLVVWLAATKKLKMLFRWQHFAGIVFFLLITGAYYALYYKYNPDSLGTLFKTILNESTKKSAVGMGMSRTVIHLATFPFELMFHFIPWTFLVIYLFKKENLKLIWGNKFLRFCILVFLGNIVVYWLSPDTFPRYLFMLMPLVFIPLIQVHYKNEAANTRHFNILGKVLLVFVVLAAAVLLAYPLVPQTQGTPYAWFKSIILLLPTLGIIYYFKTKKRFLLEMLIIVLLLTRIGFNWFIQPVRFEESSYGVFRGDVMKVCVLADKQELFYNDSTMKHPFMYDLTTQRKRLLKYEKPENAKGLFIMNAKDTASIAGGEKLMDIHYYKNEKQYVLVRFSGGLKGF